MELVNVTPYNYTHGDEYVSATQATPTGNAYPTGRALDGSSDHGAAVEWIEPAELPDGRRCYRVFLFSDADITDDDGSPLEPENYPWSDDQVKRIKTAD